MNSPCSRSARSPARLPTPGFGPTHFLLLFDPEPTRAAEWRAPFVRLECPVLIGHDWPAMLALAQRVPVGLVVCAAAPGLARATSLLRRLRQRLAVMPPVVLVGPALDGEDIVAGRRAGAAEVLVAAPADSRLAERLARHWRGGAPAGDRDRRPPRAVLPAPAAVGGAGTLRGELTLAQDLHTQAQAQGQILSALERFAGHRRRAAAYLGISPGALAEKLADLRAAGVVLPDLREHK